MIIINRVAAFILAIFIGFLLGSFGNLFGYGSLIAFPFFGFGISKRMRKEFFNLRQHLSLSASMSIGIFISGFRFFSDAFLVEWPFWIKIIYILIGALLFFLSYNSQEIYHWHQERKCDSRVG